MLVPEGPPASIQRPAATECDIARMVRENERRSLHRGHSLTWLRASEWPKRPALRGAVVSEGYNASAVLYGHYRIVARKLPGPSEIGSG